MEPSRKTLSQVFSLFDEQCRGALSGSQFFRLVRALLSLQLLHQKNLQKNPHPHQRQHQLLLPVDSQEVQLEANRIARGIHVSRENQVSYEEFLEACHCHCHSQGRSERRSDPRSRHNLTPSPFEPYFGIMKLFFTEPNYPVLNEIFPFEPTYEYQTLYDWQSVPPNCESILPLSDPLPGSRRSTTHPLACYGTKKARISEECQFSLRIGRPALLDPVRVRLLRHHTVADLLQRATSAWPAHHRPAPPSSALFLVWRRSLPEHGGVANSQHSRPHSNSDASMSSQGSQSADEQQWEDVVLEPTATIEQIGLFFHYRECEIHVQEVPRSSPTSFHKTETHGERHTRESAESPRHTSPLQTNSHTRLGATHRHGSPNGKYLHSNHRTAGHEHRHSPHKESPGMNPTHSTPPPPHHHHHVDPPPINNCNQPQHACPPASSTPTSAQLLVTRLSDDFSRLRVQMQKETRHLEHLLAPWDDSLTLLRDEVPPQNTSWPDGSVLRDVDREDLRVQANALKEDLRALHTCLESLHGHAK